MNRCGWDAVWFLGTYGQPAPWWNGPEPDPTVHPWWSLKFLGTNSRGDGHVLVGIWSGPHGDLLCVRDCETREDANRWLAPSGRTILHACMKSLWLRWIDPRKTVRGLDSPIPSSAGDTPNKQFRNSPIQVHHHLRHGVDGSLPRNPDVHVHDSPT